MLRRLNLGSDCNATEFSLFDAERNPIIRRAVAVRNDEVCGRRQTTNTACVVSFTSF